MQAFNYLGFIFLFQHFFPTLTFLHCATLFPKHICSLILYSVLFVLLTKVHLVKAMVFPVVMLDVELDYEEN